MIIPNLCLDSAILMECIQRVAGVNGMNGMLVVNSLE